MMRHGHGCRYTRAIALASAGVLCGLIAAASADKAVAADWPSQIGPRESVADDYARWDGIHLGAVYGYTNLTVNFAESNTTATPPQSTTSGSNYGGFLGYNIQWEDLVVGFDGGYNRPSSLQTSVSGGGASSSLKLVDYATMRARAGYAFGQFLPYGFIGGAVARMNYATTSSSRNNAFSAGFTAGLGIDVALMPNVFLRGEWEYIAFSPLGGIRSSTNTARVGVGVRF